MTDKIFGSYSPVGTKVDRPGGGLGFPPNQTLSATEFNNANDLINQLRDNHRTLRLVDITTVGPAPAGEAWMRYTNGRVQFSVNGSDWHTLASAGVFCVRDYAGGDGNGIIDNSPAIDAALADCAAYTTATGSLATLFFHQGIYQFSRPHFLTPLTTVLGEARGAATFRPVSSPVSVHAFPFMGAPRLDNGYTHGPEALGAYHTPGLTTGSTSMYAALPGSPFSAREQWFFFNLSHSAYGRLPANASWTINFDRKLDSIIAFQSIFGINGSMYTGERPALLNITTPDGVQVKLQFRYNGQAFDITASFTGQPTPTLTGVRNNFEVSWDQAAGKMRFFLNGELWTLGAWTPTGGAGPADGSGMIQYAWEHMVVGSGGIAFGFADEPGFSYAPGYWDNFHFSTGVRHTATFTPSSTKAVADGSTSILLDFGRRYKGCLIAIGSLGLHDIYLYPWVNTAFETGGLTFRNLYFFTGMGLWAEFASGLRMDELLYVFPEEGLRFTRNGYFSHFKNIDVISAGRTGINNQAGSYIEMIGIKVSAPVCYLFNGANAVMINANASMNSDGSIGFFFTQGTCELTGCSIDAEVASGATPWLGAVHWKDMLGLKLSSCTLYNPTDKRVTDPILFANATTVIDGTIIIDGCFFLASSAGPVVKTFGANTYLTRPIMLRSPTYQGVPGSICNIPQNVIDPEAMAAMCRQGTAAPTLGTWPKGARMLNIAGTHGDPSGWYCDVAGTPGTWIPLANIP